MSLTNGVTDLSKVISMEWEPTLISNSESLTSIVSSKAFKEKLSKTLSDYEGLEPVYIEEYQSNYVSLADRIKVLEDNFEFGELWFGYEFIDRESINPTCVCTLYVLTDSGYEPWIIRLGIGSTYNVGTDGAIADAEVSAKRRVLAALGMGNDGDAEILESKGSLSIKLLQRELEKCGKSIKSIIKEYKARMASRDLEKLEIATPKDDDFESVEWGSQGEADAKNLLNYLKGTN